MIYFIISIIIILIVILYYSEFQKDKFTNYPNKYPYNPSIQTPQSNYLDITKKLEDQDKYKYDISVALSPTPTIQCDKLKSKSDCNNNGCNWFGTYCSAMYPSYL
jgi:hypothetical protein